MLVRQQHLNRTSHGRNRTLERAVLIAMHRRQQEGMNMQETCLLCRNKQRRVLMIHFTATREKTVMRLV